MLKSSVLLSIPISDFQLRRRSIAFLSAFVSRTEIFPDHTLPLFIAEESLS